jgi:hypothetical protein
MWSNFTLDHVKFGEKPTWENTAHLLPWKPGENAPGWHALPRAALVLMVVGLLSRWLGLLAARFLPERHWWGANLLVWAPRIAAVFLISEWLTTGEAASAPQWHWLRYQLAGAILFVWIALDSMARATGSVQDNSAPVPGWVPDESARPSAGAEVAAYQAVAFFATAALLVYTGNARIGEVALIMSFAMLGLAIVAGLGGSDTSGAIPAGAVFLPGLVLGTRPSYDQGNVPEEAFWLIALAPLVLLPFLIPALYRKNDWFVRVIRFLLVLAPLIAAIVLTSQRVELELDKLTQ